MALVLIHNIIIFMLVFRNLMNANLAGTVHGKKTDMDLLKERLQNALTMTILMGLTWSFGFLMIGHTKFIFQLLFCLFNSFQGLLVFVLFCWRQEDVRKTLRPHCLSAKRKSKEVVGAKADYDITSTMTGQQSARVSTEVRKNVTSTGSTSSTVLLSPNRTKMNNNFRDSVSHVWSVKGNINFVNNKSRSNLVLCSLKTLDHQLRSQNGQLSFKIPLYTQTRNAM